MLLLQVLLIGSTVFYVSCLSLSKTYHGLSFRCSRPSTQSVRSKSKIQFYRRDMFSGIVEVCIPPASLLCLSAYSHMLTLVMISLYCSYSTIVTCKILW